jgi:hypothetical protein
MPSLAELLVVDLVWDEASRLDEVGRDAVAMFSATLH